MRPNATAPVTELYVIAYRSSQHFILPLLRTGSGSKCRSVHADNQWLVGVMVGWSHHMVFKCLVNAFENIEEAHRKHHGITGKKGDRDVSVLASVENGDSTANVNKECWLRQVSAGSSCRVGPYSVSKGWRNCGGVGGIPLCQGPPASCQVILATLHGPRLCHCQDQLDIIFPSVNIGRSVTSDCGTRPTWFSQTYLQCQQIAQWSAPPWAERSWSLLCENLDT